MKDNGDKKRSPEAGYIEPIGDRKPAKSGHKMVKRKMRKISSSVASTSRPVHRTSGGRKQMVDGGKGYSMKKTMKKRLSESDMKKARATGKAAYDKGKAEYEAKPKLIKKNR